MNIIITGSLGNISKPLTEILIKRGHTVTVISSTVERLPAIQALGAHGAIGNMEDLNFLTATFSGADIVYVMEALPANGFFDQSLDVRAAINKIAGTYKQAIQQSGVKCVVHLSSIGAHTDHGNGMLAFHHDAEEILGSLPQDVSIKFIRPVGFYTNMFAFIPTIKTNGMIVSNYGGDEKEPWVSPLDIAAVIAEEMEQPFDGRSFRYVASDEVSPNEVATILGEAIGNPDLKWIVVPDEEMLQGMIAAGMNPQTARGFVEMNAARRGSVLYEDYHQHRPVLGNTKLPEFARIFGASFHQSR